jgi:hypothetical protein
MKGIIFGTVTLLIVAGIQGQLLAQGPIVTGKEFGHGSPEIVLLTTPGGTAPGCVQKVYRYNQMSNAVSLRMSYVTSGKMVVGSGEAGVATADVTGDGFDEIISAWEGADGELKLMVTPINPLVTSWPEYVACRESVNVGRCHGGGLVPWNVHITTGNFDGDPEAEFILSYWDAGARIMHKLYNVSTDAATGKIRVHYTGADSSWLLHPDLGESARFDVCAGDFDGDQQDEFATVAVRILSGRKYALYTQLYKVAGSGVECRGIVDSLYIVDQDLFAYDLNLGEGYQYESVGIAAADLNGRGRDEIVVSYQVRESNWWRPAFSRYDNKYVAFVTSVEIRDDLSGGTPAYTQTWVQDWYNILNTVIVPDYRRYPGAHTGISAGDVDGDGRDEVFWHRNSTLLVLDLMDLFATASVEVTSPPNGNTCVTYIADLDTVGSFPPIPEILVADWAEGGRLRTFRPQLVGAMVSGLTEVSKVVGLGFNWCVGMAVGDFDGTYFKLGTPKNYPVTGFVQPTVIVKAPPTHFDILGGTTHDIPGCYPAGTGSIVSSYVQQSTTDTTVQLTFTRDWGISASVAGGISYMGVTVKAGLSVAYGEQFSRDLTQRTSTTIIEGVAAATDDQILSTIVDYDLWEYPILTRDGETSEKLLVADPKPSRRQWTAGKSANSWFYVPSHEVGNILSYLSSNSLTASPLVDRYVAAGSDQDIGDGALHHEWSIYQADFGSVSGSSSRGIGLAVGASVSGWGMEVAVQGSYGQSEISTQVTSVQQDFQLKFETGQYSTPVYTITPHVYWATNGALVLDYSVKVPKAVPGQDPTFWEVHYGQHPDPAISLPWRFDAQKGLSTTFPPLFTRDISFDPPSTRVNDSVTVRARIRNYSLVGTVDPVQVSFYIGDPASGGTIIQSADMRTKFSTAGPVDPLGTSIIEFTWIVPSTIPDNPRIYALVDPDQTMAEIHEDNNKAYSVLIVDGPLGADDPETPTNPQTFELLQNYPNPFNPVTRIKYHLPEASTVKLAVYDLLGREVAVVVNEKKAPGFYDIDFDARELASGVYLYRLTAAPSMGSGWRAASGGFVQTRKMVVLK